MSVTNSWLPASGFLFVLQRGLSSIGIVINLILIKLIIFHSPKELSLYKYLMIYISCFELSYEALEILLPHDIFTMDSAFFVIADADKSYLPDSWLKIANLIYCGYFAVSLAIFNCQFAYRYHALKGNNHWTKSNPKNYALWFGTPLILSTVYTTFVRVFLHPNEYTEKVMREFVYPHGQYENKTVWYYAILFYPKLDDGTEIINWRSFVGVSVTTGMLIASEIAMLYFAFGCFRSFKSLVNQTNCSAIYRKLQWQLFCALVVQAMIPILLLQLPMTLIYSSTMILDNSIPHFGHLQEITLAVYLAIDALPTILIIKQYREAIRKFFCCFRGTSSTAPMSLAHAAPIIDASFSMSNFA